MCVCVWGCEREGENERERGRERESERERAREREMQTHRAQTVSQTLEHAAFKNTLESTAAEDRNENTDTHIWLRFIVMRWW